MSKRTPKHNPKVTLVLPSCEIEVDPSVGTTGTGFLVGSSTVLLS